MLLPGQRRKKGKARATLSFRAHQEIWDYVAAEAKRTGGDRSDILTHMIEVMMDAERIIGPELWRDLDRQAAIDGVTPGVALGELVKGALKSRKR